MGAQQVLACSNCEQGAADRYWWLTAALFLAAIIAAATLLVRLSRGGIRLRVFGLLAIAVLMVGGWLSLKTLAARIHVRVNGVTQYCDSALTAAETTGAPNSAALDDGQLACRRAGQQRLRHNLPPSATVAAIGLVATVAGIGASLGRSSAVKTAP
jgi:hypothetical protein